MCYLEPYPYIIDYQFSALTLSINYAVVILLMCANYHIDIILKILCVGDSGPCGVTCVCTRCCGMVLPRDAPGQIQRTHRLEGVDNPTFYLSTLEGSLGS
jgi:hypothetical protein